MNLLLIISGLILTAVGILQKIYLYRNYPKNSLSEKITGRRSYDRGYKKARQMKNINHSPDDSLSSKFRINNDNVNHITSKNKRKNIEQKNSNKFADTNDFKSILINSRQGLNLSGLSGKYREVIALSQEHKDIEQIARKLDLGVRETKLIIKLHRRKADKNGS